MPAGIAGAQGSDKKKKKKKKKDKDKDKDKEDDEGDDEEGRDEEGGDEGGDGGDAAGGAGAIGDLEIDSNAALAVLMSGAQGAAEVAAAQHEAPGASALRMLCHAAH